MDFSIGDRVWFEEAGRVEGTYAKCDGIYHYVQRDDGVMGSGRDGEWLIWTENENTPLHRIEGQPKTVAAEDHIAGLTPERVDWDKVMHGRWE